MTGGSAGAGPPMDAEVDAGWDALLGEAPTASEAAVPAIVAPIPPPVVPLAAPVAAAEPPLPPADVEATAATGAVSPVGTAAVVHAGVERAIAASGRLGAAVVEDDEVGAARSGRRVRVTGRVSQREDEPAAASGSISVVDDEREVAESETPPRERPKVAVRAAAPSAPHRAAGVRIGSEETPPSAGGWSWVGLAVIGAVIVGGLFFVQSSMRGRGDATADVARADQDETPSKSKASAKAAATRRDGEATPRTQDPRPGGRATRPRDPAAASAATGDAAPAGDVPLDAPGTVAPPETASGSDAVEPTRAAPEEGPPADPGAESGDPRAVPAGTSPEAASAFKKIPASAGDGPPVGAIGLSGIHVDDITLGDEWASSRCAGETSRFSIAADKPVNVCLRIVHHRAEEQLAVAWQQNGRTVRRSKIKVPDLHAYRTRAYLALRREYVGSWTVRITSTDGAEVASASFEIVE